MKSKVILAAAISALTFTHCYESRITSVWTKPDATPKAMKKLMIVGIIRETDRSLREKMEKHLTDDLRAKGINAYSAYQQYGPLGLQNLSETDMYKKLEKDSVDGVLTIVLLNKEMERYYVPGHITYSPYFFYHDRFWGYYNTLNMRIQTSGYYEETTQYFWESNLFRLPGNELIYSAQTSSFDPSSKEILAHDYGIQIVKSLQEKKVLP